MFFRHSIVTSVQNLVYILFSMETRSSSTVSVMFSTKSQQMFPLSNLGRLSETVPECNESSKLVPHDKGYILHILNILKYISLKYES